MIREEIEFITDVIQDNSANARIEQNYDNLVYALLKNARLNWDETGLRFGNEEKIFNFLEIIEPRLVSIKLNELKNKEKETETETETE